MSGAFREQAKAAGDWWRKAFKMPDQSTIIEGGLHALAAGDGDAFDTAVRQQSMIDVISARGRERTDWTKVEVLCQAIEQYVENFLDAEEAKAPIMRQAGDLSTDYNPDRKLAALARSAGVDTDNITFWPWKTHMKFFAGFVIVGRDPVYVDPDRLWEDERIYRERLARMQRAFREHLAPAMPFVQEYLDLWRSKSFTEVDAAEEKISIFGWTGRPATIPFLAVRDEEFEAITDEEMARKVAEYIALHTITTARKAWAQAEEKRITPGMEAELEAKINKLYEDNEWTKEKEHEMQQKHWAVLLELRNNTPADLTYDVEKHCLSTYYAK